MHARKMYNGYSAHTGENRFEISHTDVMLAEQVINKTRENWGSLGGD
jgi:hypothetical protein